MKKLFAVCLLMMLVSTVAFAEVDLSAMSFDELAALRDQCQMEMMNRDEWQEVTVPQGVYEIGKQIPAGTWIIRCADIGRNDYLLSICDITWGIGAPDNGNRWTYSKQKGEVRIYNPNNENYRGETAEYTITLNKGEFISIHPQYNKVVFTPYTGVPSFSFK